MKGPAGAGNNMRHQPRHKTVRFVWYRVLGATGPEAEGMARSCDMSKTGIGILTPRPLPSGALLFLEIALRDFNLSVVGKVQHVASAEADTYRAGVEFVAIPPNDRVLLSRLFKSQEGQAP